jgi:hypothetical protein
MSKLLFIIKKREMTFAEDRVLNSSPPRANFSYCVSSGLRNSAQFIVDMLNERGIETKIVEVIDNNCIDREVTAYKPTHVIIEAYWVTPTKFDQLIPLHPKVQWIIRNHSEMPFLANDGIAVDWTMKYLAYRNVFVAPNSIRSFNDIKKIVSAAYGELVAEYKILYLPNYYSIKKQLSPRKRIGDTIDVGCFGAIRPLKNHLIQAIAALHFARMNRKNLRFHINIARIEDSGNPVLNSIRGLFNNLDPTRYQLVEHGWLNHDDFLKLVDTMDIGLQASFTESFNIVAADFVSQGVPIVVSSEIDWLPKDFIATHTDAQHIVDTMEKVLFGYKFWSKAKYALKGLLKYNSRSKHIWMQMFGDREQD